MDVGWCTSNISWVVRPLISDSGVTKTLPVLRKILPGTRTGWANSSGLTHGDKYPHCRTVELQGREVPIPGDS